LGDETTSEENSVIVGEEQAERPMRRLVIDSEDDEIEVLNNSMELDVVEQA
jgi:hypothetical protein